MRLGRQLNRHLRMFGAGLPTLLVFALAAWWIASYGAPSVLAAPAHAASPRPGHAHAHAHAHSHSHSPSGAPRPARRPVKVTARAAGLTSRPEPVAAAGSGALRFGIYPWGSVGASATIAPSVPENADASMAAVQQLRGGHPFVVHLYASYTDTSMATADGMISEATWWSANGLKVAAVLRYTPTDASQAAGYVPWVRALTKRLAAIPGTVSIQIANEPNNLWPGTGDGAFPGVIAAIAAGVPAARRELVADRRPDVLVGFNWASGSAPTTTDPMWRQLRQAGGTAFTSAVGFVAVNTYPGTWSPPSSIVAPTSTQIAAGITSTLKALRLTDMPAAGVGAAAIVIGETGYPTSLMRTEVTQSAVVAAIISTVNSIKATYGVSDLYLFDLRDGNTGSGQLENGYGILHDDYSPKPAFATLQQLVASIGV